ncbi:hypothetical protein SanaruYs_05720 [Chryseotalea sanaruensis]|uniref:Outer membrane protein beta-barrel domain-containing protein n=1 Tax=Chryseotalea sanaruensis TaxID=2482724 RepID=A0A401U652_9BACT|nr:hypothetical protein [Chryseotalea sanaruensis]GCC50357.1 hypothetical protein SanaruYs_05720 [Chryseotalea sanaruensis]
MKATLTFLTIIFGLVLITKGQTEITPYPKINGGGGGFTIGLGAMDIATMHVFVPQDVSSFSKQHLLLGGSGYGIVNSFVLGGTGTGILSENITTDSLKIQLGGGYGTFDFGYLIINRDKLRLFPTLGIGGGGYSVSIAKNKNISANAIASDPGREVNINNGGFIFDAAINLNIIPFLELDEKNNSYGGLMLGTKIGYVYGLPTTNWSFAGGDITNGPDFGIKMFYVKLFIGGFGFDKH